MSNRHQGQGRDESLSILPCRYLNGPDSDSLTTIQIYKGNEEQPCAMKVDKILLVLAMGMVGEAACALQRECGVCPRGLGKEVDQRLIPLNRRNVKTNIKS